MEERLFAPEKQIEVGGSEIEGRQVERDRDREHRREPKRMIGVPRAAQPEPEIGEDRDARRRVALDVTKIELGQPQRGEHRESGRAGPGSRRDLRGDSPQDRRGGRAAEDGQDADDRRLDGDSERAQDPGISGPGRRRERLAVGIRLAGPDSLEPYRRVAQEKGPESELPEDPRPGQEQEPAAPPRKAKRVRPGGSARRAAPGVATARGLLDARRARAEEVDDEEERGAEEERHDEEACRRGKESGEVEPPGPRPWAMARRGNGEGIRRSAGRE